MPGYRSRPDEDHELLCELGDDELRLKGDQLAEAVQAKQNAEAEQKAANAIFKQRIDAANEVGNRLKTEILSKSERRPVACRWKVEHYGDDQREAWVLRRTDTGALVTTQAVTQADRQQELSLS
jgi:hypothetical protein